MEAVSYTRMLKGLFLKLEYLLQNGLVVVGRSNAPFLAYSVRTLSNQSVVPACRHSINSV